MQPIIVTKDSLFSEAVTCAMLREMASKLFQMSDEAIEKSASEPLTKGTKHMKELTCAKLRTILATKLANSPDDEFGQLWRNGELEVEFDHLPDLDIGKAGANTKRGGAAGTRPTKLVGEYHVVKKSGTADKDPGKWAIWEHVWACSSFEDFFKAAPAKSTTATNRVISASSEIQWALKSGWIKAGKAEQPSA